MQAARGTPLSPLGSGTKTSAAQLTPGRRRVVLTLFAAAALVPYALDQLSKILAVDRLSGQPDRALIGEVLHLHLTRNPGAAFSLGTGYTEVFSGIAILAVLVVLFLARRLGSTLWAFALGVLLAGVAGNLTDRLVREPGPLRGHVVDFLMLPHWPIFNVADIWINVAAALILVQAFRGVRLDGTRVSADQDADQDDAMHEKDKTTGSPPGPGA